MNDSAADIEPATENSPDATRRVSHSRRALLGASATALASLAGCTGTDGIVVGKRDESESTLDVSSGTIRVDADRGGVSVRRGAEDVVRVHVEKSGSLVSSLSSVTVSTRREGDTAIVEVTDDSDGVFDLPPDLTVRIDVPRDVAIESVRLENGIARVDGVSADGATIRTRNGAVHATELDGDVHVTTGNGSVTVERVAGFVTARSDNGSVTIRDCDGVDGASTQNGAIAADVSAIRDDTTIESDTGAIEAALAPDLDAHVVATSKHGRVQAAGVLVDPSVNTQTAVEGQLGEGAHDLELSTTNGSISITSLS